MKLVRMAFGRILWVALGVLLVSCAPTGGTPMATEAALLARRGSATPSPPALGGGGPALQPSVTRLPGLATPLSQPAATRLPGVTPAPAASSHAATAGAPGVVTGRSPFQVCSPLSEIKRIDLSRIVSAPYDPPSPGSDDRHQGVDFAFYNFRGHRQIAGTGVQAIMGGTAAAVLTDTYPYGNLIIIETPGDSLPTALRAELAVPEGTSLYHLYSHLQDASLTIQPGETVRPCQVIGAVGKSGNTLAAHLHMEIRIGPAGQTFPGMSYFTDEATPEEKKAYRRWRTSWEFQHFDPLRLLGYDFTNWVTATPAARRP